MKFTIEIDDDDRGDVIDHPWTANVFRVDPETGKSGDVMGTGFGNTPSQAVAHALEDIGNNTDDDAMIFLIEDDR